MVEEKTKGPFGLPKSLKIPIAAASIAAIHQYVGDIDKNKIKHDADSGRVNAIVVKTRIGDLVREPEVPLWRSAWAPMAYASLYPTEQFWVHVNYNGYRKAYIDFNMPAIHEGYFLDHVQNR